MQERIHDILIGMTHIFPLNHGWRYLHDDDVSFAHTGFDDRNWASVDIPHSLVETSASYVDPDAVATVGWYRKVLRPRDFGVAERYMLRFEAISVVAEVHLDGMCSGTHVGAYTPFEIEIPKQLHHRDEIVVAIRCDANESPDIPPFGNVVDYVVPGGMYGQVSLVTTGMHAIKDVFCRSEPAHERMYRTLSVQVSIETETRGEVKITLLDGDKTVCAEHSQQVFSSPVECAFPVGPVHLWDTISPNLYTIETTLTTIDGERDVHRTRIGFRDCEFNAQGFFLNGRNLKLKGLNRHQDYPHVGYAMPKSQQHRDAEFLKRELHVDLVRTSHYPQSPHFLDRCDELGLLVFEELPGWQHVGAGERWRTNAVQQLKEMLVRDRNHPSIILWGVRINESMDDDQLYDRTNAVARELDPSRPTAGVRNFAGSRLLEDVYTYNDFSFTGTGVPLEDPDRVSKDKSAPYLVTEHTGHMYPCRASDAEMVRTEHALRHAKVLDAMYGNARISGAIGWCMADYHTHFQFGGGDAVCYHGVANMYRIPKLASALYASQQDESPILEISSDLHIGAVPAHMLDNVWVFTNCDEVVLWYGGVVVKTFLPDRRRFPHLPHPPMLLDDLIGARIDALDQFTTGERTLLREVLVIAARKGFEFPLPKKIALGMMMKRHHLGWEDAVDLYGRFVLCWDGSPQRWSLKGMIADKEVASLELGNAHKTELSLVPDRNCLELGDTYDVVRCVVHHKNSFGRILRLSHAPVNIRVDGVLDLIGPCDVALDGGSVGFYLRTKGETGSARVVVASPYLEKVETIFTVD